MGEHPPAVHRLILYAWVYGELVGPAPVDAQLTGLLCLALNSTLTSRTLQLGSSVLLRLARVSISQGLYGDNDYRYNIPFRVGINDAIRDTNVRLGGREPGAYRSFTIQFGRA